jgi:hypothetical protein
MSASGQYQSACIYGAPGGIYYSTDYGQTWTASGALPLNWYSIAMSASGQYQSACITTGGSIYYSTNYGQTWTASGVSSSNWYSIAMSASGQYQSACIFNGGIYYSTNYGQTWTASGASSSYWWTIAMSASGQYTSACINGGSGGIYTASIPYLFLSNLSNLNISPYTLTAAAFYPTSDYRIKDNVLDLDEEYTLDNLKPVQYDNKLTGQHDIGFIAHEVQEIFPYLVNGSKDDDLQNQSLNYIGLIGVLVKETKELKKRVRSLKEYYK